MKMIDRITGTKRQAPARAVNATVQKARAERQGEATAKHVANATKHAAGMANRTNPALLLAVLAIACVALLAFTGCSSSGSKSDADSSNGKKTLRVAMELAYPPFETKDEAGNPEGLAVDFIKDFAAAYDYDVQIENTAWDGLIPSLQSGQADLVISSMTITDERKESVDFSDPYAMAQLAILANADSGVTSIDDLNQPDKKVAVKTGSTGDVYATKNLTNAQIVRLADESACVTEVVQGKADGFLYDQLTIYRNHQANPDTTEAVFIPFQDAEAWGIAVKKGDTELLDQLNAFIAQSKEDGEFDRLTEKYLAQERKAFDEYHFKWFFDFD